MFLFSVRNASLDLPLSEMLNTKTNSKPRAQKKIKTVKRFFTKRNLKLKPNLSEVSFHWWNRNLSSLIINWQFMNCMLLSESDYWANNTFGDQQRYQSSAEEINTLKFICVRRAFLDLQNIYSNVLPFHM